MTLTQPADTGAGLMTHSTDDHCDRFSDPALERHFQNFVAMRRRLGIPAEHLRSAFAFGALAQLQIAAQNRLHEVRSR